MLYKSVKAERGEEVRRKVWVAKLEVGSRGLRKDAASMLLKVLVEIAWADIVAASYAADLDKMTSAGYLVHCTDFWW